MNEKADFDDAEKRLAIATELLRLAEKRIKDDHPHSAPTIEIRMGKFLDEEYRAMGVPNRQQIYKIKEARRNHG